MNTYIISYDADSNLDQLKSALKRFEGYYNFFQNSWLVKTEIGTAKEVYDELIRMSGCSSDRIVVFKVDGSSAPDSYWGRMNENLWEWMKD